MNCNRLLRRPFKMHPVRIDNRAFWLNYKVTSFVIVLVAVFVAISQWFGYPMYCFRVGPILEFLDIFCGDDLQFSVPIGLTGLANSSRLRSTVEVKGHYLIYIVQPWFILLVQALYFYLPYHLWRSMECGKLQSIILDLNRPRVSGVKKAQCETALVNYLAANLHKQNLYALKFFLSETLNLINVVAQTIVLHYYLGYYFVTNGIDVLLSETSHERELGITVSNIVPRSTNCTVRGDFLSIDDDATEAYSDEDFFCFVPRNRVSAMICVLLWYWFICLSVITAGSVLCTAVDLLNSSVHLTVMRARDAVMLVQLKYQARNTHFGAWFLLNSIKKNIHPEIFKEIVSDLTKKLYKEKDNINTESV